MSLVDFDPKDLLWIIYIEPTAWVEAVTFYESKTGVCTFIFRIEIDS